jgi:para-nitrobenzyl esterase
VRTTCPWQAFIHGGGFMGGNGAQHVLRGSHLAASRCIVVANFNYRLGPLGFFPAHVDAGQSGGMNGLLDQIHALAWLRKKRSGIWRRS